MGSYLDTFFSSPGRIGISSFLLLISIGSLILYSPLGSNGMISYLDALFVATSATCVTGMLSVPLTNFTMVGLTTIMLLMQIGGLGLATLSIFFMSRFFSLRLKTRSFTGQLLEMDGWTHVHELLTFIVTMSLSVEAIGAIIIYAVMRAQDTSPIGMQLFKSLFHAISAFMNAGISLYPTQVLFNTSPLFFAVTVLMVFIGGLGFFVWQEIIDHVRARIIGARPHYWSLHTKIIMHITVLITGAFATILALQEFNILHASSLSAALHALGYALANSIGLRSSGFTSLVIDHLHLATLFATMIFAFIGSSPGSTGSGIKTTTFALFLATMRATIRQRSNIEIKGRTIPAGQIFKAMAILVLSMALIALSTFCLLITERGFRFIDILFEASSAFANLGVTTGLTQHLSPIGKIVIIITMILGRIGSLTLLLAIKKGKEKRELQYPEERVMLG